MINREKLFYYLHKWSAQYSPFNPLEVNDINDEMKLLANGYNSNDVHDLIKIYNSLSSEYIEYYDMFMYYYVNSHATELSSVLFKYLKPEGPSEIIDLISYTQISSLSSRLINTLKYDDLKEETKISLFNALTMLGDKESIDFLRKVKEVESNAEILDVIESSISFLASVK